jgi:hypothetical protein
MMFFALVLLAIVVMFYGAYLAIFRRGKRRRGLYVALGAFIGMTVFAIMGSEHDARIDGWTGAAEQTAAEKRGIADPATYRATVTLEAAVTAASDAAADAKRKRAGFHCVSSWNGHHLDMIRQVKAQMRDPDSFEASETRIAPVDSEGKHTILMEYRAKNGFGGINVGVATGTVNTLTCDVTVVEVD